MDQHVVAEPELRGVLDQREVAVVEREIVRGQRRVVAVRRIEWHPFAAEPRLDPRERRALPRRVLQAEAADEPRRDADRTQQRDQQARAPARAAALGAQHGAGVIRRIRALIAEERRGVLIERPDDLVDAGRVAHERAGAPHQSGIVRLHGLARTQRLRVGWRRVLGERNARHVDPEVGRACGVAVRDRALLGLHRSGFPAHPEIRGRGVLPKAKGARACGAAEDRLAAVGDRRQHAHRRGLGRRIDFHRHRHRPIGDRRLLGPGARFVGRAEDARPVGPRRGARGRIGVRGDRHREHEQHDRTQTRRTDGRHRVQRAAPTSAANARVGVKCSSAMRRAARHWRG